MHLQGVLAMSWSGHDAGLLLSSAKDNRTILWDVATGETLGELSAGDNWDFDVLWSPSNPGVFATSSYGAGEGSSGKVSLPSAALQELLLPSAIAFQLLILPSDAALYQLLLLSFSLAADVALRMMLHALLQPPVWSLAQTPLVLVL